MSSGTPPLILHTDWSRSWGGQEIRTMTEVEQMCEIGFRCCLMVPEDSELARRGRMKGFDIWPVEFHSKFHVGSWRKIIKGLRKLRPSVVNTHSSEDSWMVGPAARLLGIPLVVRTRHVLQPVSSTFSYNFFPHVILACSEAIRDSLIEQGVPAKKIFVQPTGIDERRFRYSQESRERIRKQFGLSAGDILVGNVGFLREYKGQIFIVQTAAEMADNYKFMLVGDGGDRPRLEAEIQRLGVQDRFFITGHRENPEEYFSAFDILFFSSWSVEGIAQSYIQGLLYGLPLLVCKTPSILEPLAHVQNYRLIDYQDLDAARSGLLELSRYIERDEKKITRQRDAITKLYGLQTMTENVLGIYAQHGVAVDV